VPDDAVPLRHNRDFALLWSGQAISALGSRMSGLAYPLLVLGLTGSASRAGLVGFVDTVPLLLFYLPAGALVDRWDRRRTMLACDAGRCVAVGTVAGLLLAGHLPYPVILVAAFCEGTLSVFFQLSNMAALRHVVPDSQLRLAFARNEARAYGASILGQPLGGILYGISRMLPFLADAASYLVSFTTIALIRTRFGDERPPPRERILGQIAEGMRWLWGHPFLRACAFLVAGSNFVWSALFLVVIVRMRDLGASSGAIGLSLSLVGVGGLVGALAAPRIQARVAARDVVIGASWVWAALVPLLCVAPTPLTIGLLFAGMSAIGPVWNTTVVAYRLSIVPDRLSGRVNSVARLIAMSALPLASLLAGLLLDRIGAIDTLVVLAVFSLGVAVVTTLVPSIRRGPRLHPAPAGSAVR
jgi:MFS family permease